MDKLWLGFKLGILEAWEEKSRGSKKRYGGLRRGFTAAGSGFSSELAPDALAELGWVLISPWSWVPSIRRAYLGRSLISPRSWVPSIRRGDLGWVQISPWSWVPSIRRVDLGQVQISPRSWAPSIRRRAGLCIHQCWAPVPGVGRP